MSHKKQQSEDIFTALIHSYNTLTRSETKVADYILRHKQMDFLLVDRKSVV